MGLHEIGLVVVICGLMCGWVSETLWRGGAKLAASIVITSYVVWLVFMAVVSSG